MRWVDADSHLRPTNGGPVRSLTVFDGESGFADGNPALVSHLPPCLAAARSVQEPLRGCGQTLSQQECMNVRAARDRHGIDRETPRRRETGVFLPLRVEQGAGPTEASGRSVQWHSLPRRRALRAADAPRSGHRRPQQASRDRRTRSSGPHGSSAPTVGAIPARSQMTPRVGRTSSQMLAERADARKPPALVGGGRREHASPSANVRECHVTERRRIIASTILK